MVKRYKTPKEWNTRRNEEGKLHGAYKNIPIQTNVLQTKTIRSIGKRIPWGSFRMSGIKLIYLKPTFIGE